MYKFSFIFLALLFVGCISQEQTEEADNESTTMDKPAVSNNKLDSQKDHIDVNEEQYDLASSLSFQHNDGSTEEVLAYLDKDKKIVKIKENFSVGKTGDVGSRVFYLENGLKFLSIEICSDNVNANGAFKEKVSYYDTDGNVLSTKERSSILEESLENEAFVDTENYDCSMEIAENVLNNKGVFSTTFQGFAENGHLTYLLVGGPGETGYASGLAVQYEDSQIKKLMADQKSFVDQPLSVQFEKMVDEKNLEFQVLVGLTIE